MPTVSRVRALTSTPLAPAQTCAALIEAIVVLESMSAATTAPMPTCPAPSTPPAPGDAGRTVGPDDHGSARRGRAVDRRAGDVGVGRVVEYVDFNIEADPGGAAAGPRDGEVAQGLGVGRDDDDALDLLSAFCALRVSCPLRDADRGGVLVLRDNVGTIVDPGPGRVMQVVDRHGSSHADSGRTGNRARVGEDCVVGLGEEVHAFRSRHGRGVDVGLGVATHDVDRHRAGKSGGRADGNAAGQGHDRGGGLGLNQDIRGGRGHRRGGAADICTDRVGDVVESESDPRAHTGAKRPLPRERIDLRRIGRR